MSAGSTALGNPSLSNRPFYTCCTVSGATCLVSPMSCTHVEVMSQHHIMFYLCMIECKPRNELMPWWRLRKCFRQVWHDRSLWDNIFIGFIDFHWVIGWIPLDSWNFVVKILEIFDSPNQESSSDTFLTSQNFGLWQNREAVRINHL